MNMLAQYGKSAYIQFQFVLSDQHYFHSYFTAKFHLIPLCLIWQLSLETFFCGATTTELSKPGNSYSFAFLWHVSHDIST